MERSEILKAAECTVNGSRDEQYGTPEDNFLTIARYWTAYLQKYVSEVDVANMMILMKLARIKKNPAHTDSWIDVAGYAACGGEISTRGDNPAATQWVTNDVFMGVDE